jgi:hypothetical protein
MSPESAPSLPPDCPVSDVQAQAQLPYEPPVLTPVGNLHHLLGKSGPRADATYRRPSAGRP